MVDKTKLHLEQEVLVGAEEKKAVIVGLTRSFTGVIFQNGGYETVSFDDIKEVNHV